MFSGVFFCALAALIGMWHITCGDNKGKSSGYMDSAGLYTLNTKSVEVKKVANLPGTDPVVRDYIMQHLGHLWEQNGANKEIDIALWRALDSQDETTPGTALIALSDGYSRDYNDRALVRVQQRALALAQNSDTPLAVRVTALSIAGEGGSAEVKTLAENLLQKPETPVILRKVAEAVAR